MLSLKRTILFFICLLMMLANACKNSPVKKITSIFQKKTVAETALSFINKIIEDDATNLISNEYAYMGGGVGIGDFNNDGLQDIFFSANQASSQLYINEGKNRFKNVTTSAGIQTKAWCTGVSVADINNDGWQDMYVCVSGNAPSQNRRNLLFINNHNLTFTEHAAEYGLADTSYSTQAAFLDYDKDGDLDMYLVNNQIGAGNPNNILAKDVSGNSIRNDRLYKNNGVVANKNHPVFTDVSIEAGIKEDGYGLGVVVSDINDDGWPDMYVTNDYVSNDLLWLNNKNGSFTNVIASSLNHQSYSSMGVDAADINNDGLIDIATLDMMPEESERQKMMYSFLSYERYEMERNAGYEPELMRNMLHLNNGNLKISDTVLPRFSEIGQLAGISRTDWSWSVLMADFDNDGWNDMHITNGMGKDLINADFVLYRANTKPQDFAAPRDRWKALQEKLNGYGAVPLQNYFYKNNKNYGFDNFSGQAGIGDLSISNGAAYADFDNDGDLDLVVNNINQEAFFYENIQTTTNRQHYICFILKGDSLNRDALGARIFLYAGNKIQIAEQSPVRGYLSSVDKRLHFGLGKSATIDSVIVIWPDEKIQTLVNLETDTTVVIKNSDARKSFFRSTVNTPLLFTDITNTIAPGFKHYEPFFNDYSFQRLLPQKYSQLGPCISIGDINADGLQDFFIGGAFNQSGKIGIQQTNGQFTETDLVNGKKYEEDMGSAFFDADGDEDLDLLVTGGSTEVDKGSPYYTPRLYLNDSRGNFTLNVKAIPAAVNTSAFGVSTCDYDKDGDVDLFIGGRVSVDYPETPNSYLLQNNKGVFTDVTASVSESLSTAGMITAAVWTDFDNDNQTDIILAGEWIPLRFYRNEKGKFTEVTANAGLPDNNGMWRSLIATDIDNDGDDDLVAGNAGLNNKYGVDALHPLKLFASDMDANGSIDPVICYHWQTRNGERKLLPAYSLMQLAEQVPAIRKKFLLNKDYSRAGISQIIDDENSISFSCMEMNTCWFENIGRGKFKKHLLPVEAQFAPVNSLLCHDFNSDGIKDILMAGNEYQTDVATGRYDASYGLLLIGKRDKTFNTVSPSVSGFAVKGDVKDLKYIVDQNSKVKILVAVNNETMKIFSVKQPEQQGKIVTHPIKGH
jgi:enediyne biosynthesis protein E4